MRNVKEIDKWMTDEDLTVTGIASEIDCHHSLVSNTIASRKNNRKVLRFLLNKGCPAEFLDLPEDMKEAA